MTDGATPCCSVGARADVEAIDAALRDGQGLGTVAKRHGTPETPLTKPTLGRHRLKCLGIRGETPGETPTETGADTSETRGKKSGETSRDGGSRFNVPNPGDDPLTAPRKVVRASIEAQCVDLRARGKSYVEIADTLGIDEATATDAVERVLIRTRRGADAKADMARRLDLTRIDMLLGSLWDRATDPKMAKVDVPADTESGVKAYDGQDKAIDRVTKLLERRAKLLGLDAPQAVAVTLLDKADDSTDFTDVYRVMRRLLDARFPGATAFLTEGLEHYRVRGDPGVDALLAGDMALSVIVESSTEPGDPDAVGGA